LIESDIEDWGSNKPRSDRCYQYQPTQSIKRFPQYHQLQPIRETSRLVTIISYNIDLGGGQSSLLMLGGAGDQANRNCLGISTSFGTDFLIKPITIEKKGIHQTPASLVGCCSTKMSSPSNLIFEPGHVHHFRTSCSSVFLQEEYVFMFISKPKL